MQGAFWPLTQTTIIQLMATKYAFRIIFCERRAEKMTSPRIEQTALPKSALYVFLLLLKKHTAR